MYRYLNFFEVMKPLFRKLAKEFLLDFIAPILSIMRVLFSIKDPPKAARDLSSN